MPALPYGKGSYRRETGNFPELKLVNLFVEPSPSSDGGVALQSRAGLLASIAAGAGPVSGIFAQAGTFGGDKFWISGTTLYREGASLGTIAGTGPVSWAASDNEVVVTRGGAAYSYNGTNLAAISFPDGASVTAVCFIAGLFVFVRAASQKFYWSSVYDARTIDGLAFASAELKPDQLLDCVSISGVLYLIGQESIEAWYPNGDLAIPFTRIDQRLFTKGVTATGCARILDNTLFFIGNDKIVYRVGEVPQRLSDFGIEEQIAASPTVFTFTYSYQGHSFFCIRLDSHTYAYDVATSEWCEFASYGRANYRARCACNVGAVPFFGDDELGQLWTFGTVFQDNGAALEAYFTAGFPINGGAEIIDSVEVKANVGFTDPLSGDDANPIIEMRTSRDGGATWGTYRDASLGAQGKYRTRAKWRRLGMFDSPGFLAMFRITDRSPRRISNVLFNEPGGGRSR